VWPSALILLGQMNGSHFLKNDAESASYYTFVIKSEKRSMTQAIENKPKKD
jgi:hypothetical protein